MAVNEELLKQVLEQIRPNLQGACAGGPMSRLALAMGIGRVLKEPVPGVTGVVAVNDNADGGLSSLYDESAPF